MADERNEMEVYAGNDPLDEAYEISRDIDEMEDSHEDLDLHEDRDIFDAMLDAQEMGLRKSEIRKARGRQRARVLGEKDVVAIDSESGEVGYVTNADIAKKALEEMRSAWTVGRPLKGIVSRVSLAKNSDGSPFLVGGAKTYCCNVMYGPINVMIPLPFMMRISPNERLKTAEEKDKFLKLLANERIGSEVEFVIKSLDERSMTAVASRLDALDLARGRWMQKKSRSYVLREGDIIEARVCYVTNGAVCVEAFGIEQNIPLREITYRRLSSARDLYMAGDRIPVKIMSLKRTSLSEGGFDIQVELSAKEAEHDPRELYMRHIDVGDTSIGIVKQVTARLVYVGLHGLDIDVICHQSKEFTPPSKGQQVLVVITEKDEEAKELKGNIIRKM